MQIEILSLADIAIPDKRHRQEFDEAKLTELGKSILALGNIHPPVLRNEDNTLVAGERRYRAITTLATADVSYECNGQMIPPGSIAITRMGQLTPLQLREVELEENLRRVDLSWQERERAVADLHALRMAQSEGTQTFTDTAREIKGDDPSGPDVMNARNATIIAQHLNDPEVAKAKDSKEAMKIITKKAERDLRRQLAEEFGTEAVTDTAALHNMDAIEGLRGIEAESVDVFLTDPPYGIEAQSFGDQADLDHNYDDSFATWLVLMTDLARETARVAKPQAHAYVFCDIRNFNVLSDLFAEADWNVWPTPLIWDKGNGMLPRPDHGPRRCYESILFASRGNRGTTAVYSDVISIRGDANKLHAAQKPVALYSNLLQRTVLPGDTVCDPFAGSGTIFPAARAVACRAIGFELDPASYAIGLGRIEGEGE